ncbi:unnamed protein product [Chironomus riparius]|uniref:Uncharacterized protein n=1 Tax=Chironomus riparius TaxID=315576 RepID=A0A9N9RN64_9DIPT|nr:unnamed protein product [Chironomus riparius]
MGLKSKNKHSRINFDDPSTTRPGSLAKSAVLAALEEDERNKAGSKPGPLNMYYRCYNRIWLQ